MRRRVAMAGAGAGVLLLVFAAGEIAGAWSLIPRRAPASGPSAVREIPVTAGRAPALEGRDAARTPPSAAGDALPASVDLEKVDRTLDLHGVVVRTNDAPVAGAMLEAVEFPWRRANVLEHERYDVAVPTASTRSAADGTFRIPLRCGGVFALRASAAGLAPTDVADCQPGQRLKVVLADVVALVVHATDPDGKDLPGTTIELRAGRTYRGVTDQRGEHRFEGLPAGRAASLEASHGPLGGMAFAWRSLALPATGEGRHELVVPPGRVVGGRVTDARTGRPVAGARVGMGWTFFKETRTDDDGRYALGGWIGNYFDEIHVLADGYGRGQSKVGEKASLDFALEPGFVVEGRVLGEGRVPLAGARVFAVASEFRDRDQQISTASAVADAEGRFRLPDLVRDLSHTLVAMADGYGRTLVRVERPVGPATRVDAGDVVLPRGRRVSGVVRDGQGRGIAEMHVTLTGPRAEPATETQGFDGYYGRTEERETDDLGRFAFADLSPGSYVVSAGRGLDDADATLELVVAPGTDSDDVVIRLLPTRPLRVLVVDERGAPVSGVTMYVSPEGGRYVGEPTDAAGVASFLVPADAPRVTVDSVWLGDRPYLGVESVTVPAEQSEVRVVLSDAVIVRGTLQGPDGAPLSVATIEARRGAARVASAATDGTGAFTLRVPPGEPIDVVFRGDVQEGRDLRRRALRALQRDVKLPSASPVVLRAQPVAADRTLTVHVVTADGDVVAGAEVRVSPTPPGGVDRARTDERGDARLEGLTAEAVDVAALPPDAAAGAWARARIEDVLPDGQTVPLRLQRPHALTGVVVDADGAPVAGAEVRTANLFDGAPESVTADAQGRFSLPLPPDVEGPLSLSAFVERGGAILYAEARELLPRAGPVRLVLRLHRGW